MDQIIAMVQGSKELRGKFSSVFAPGGFGGCGIGRAGVQFYPGNVDPP